MDEAPPTKRLPGTRWRALAQMPGIEESRIPRGKDQARYPRRRIRNLVEGEDLDPETWEITEVPNWMELRALVERSGDLEAETFATVIDIERALTALASRHPEGAAVLAVVMMLDFDAAQLAGVFGERRNWARIATKSMAFMSAWLSGRSIEDCEAAWRYARD